MYSSPVAESSERMRAVRQVISVAAERHEQAEDDAHAEEQQVVAEQQLDAPRRQRQASSSSGQQHELERPARPRHRNVSSISGLTDSVGDTRYQWPSDSPVSAEPSAMRAGQHRQRGAETRKLRAGRPRARPPTGWPAPSSGTSGPRSASADQRDTQPDEVQREQHDEGDAQRAFGREPERAADALADRWAETRCAARRPGRRTTAGRRR